MASIIAVKKGSQSIIFFLIHQLKYTMGPVPCKITRRKIHALYFPAKGKLPFQDTKRAKGNILNRSDVS